MSQVHAPYHFVPLSKWVYMPEWAHLVSHDVPFQDGLSGSIEYTLTNKTPMCVGSNNLNGVNRWARDPKGNFVIPSSSMKGMFRSVLEIASFGKLANKIDDDYLTFRDISNGSYYLAEKIENKDVRSAFLKFDSELDRWTLRYCHHIRVENSELNRFLKSEFGSQTTTILNDKTYKDKKGGSQQQKVVDKYLALRDGIPTIEDLKLCFKPGSATFEGFDPSKKKKKTKNIPSAVELDKKSGQPGFLVFSGHRPHHQYLEGYCDFNYIFFDQEDRCIDLQGHEEIVDTFFKAHDEKVISFYKQNQVHELGIPVFVLEDRDTRQLCSIGLAKMPRAKYEYSFGDLAASKQAFSDQHTFDLADVMFGTLRDKGLSLKSRVLFSDLTSTTSPSYNNEKVTLATPKPSFLAAYLEQDSPDKYTNYDDSNAELAGWKRYRLSPDLVSNNSAKHSDNVSSEAEFIEYDNTFTGRIVFHNLHPIELAALVWTITLGESVAEKHYHSLGYAKALGAGQVQCNIVGIDLSGSLEAAPTVDELNTAFLAHMNSVYPSESVDAWESSPQINYLKTLTSLVEDNIGYMTYQECSAANGTEKKSLPTLVSQAQGRISRKERVEEAMLTPLSYAKGRLSELFESEAKANEVRARQVVAEKAAREKKKARESLANLSAEQRLVFDYDNMIKELAATQSKSSKNEIAKQLREIIKSLKAADLNYEDERSLIESSGLVEQKDVSKFANQLKKKHDV